MIGALVSTAGTALLFSLLLTWVVRELARHRGWMAAPASRRHVHTAPIPRLGGVAVGLSIALALTVSSAGRPELLLLLPAGWMFFIGVLDDLHGVAANRKFLAQMIAGVILFAVGFRLPVPAALGGDAASLALTVLWSATVMNAVNLVDGLDGLASGSVLCIAFALLPMTMLAGEPALAMLAGVTIGALTGFLWFNAHPASIFLGDSGSLVLGVSISAITIRLMAETSLGWLACPMLLGHPLAELVVSSTRRFLRADAIFRPDRRHLHHRLLDHGLSHSQASSILVLVSFLSCTLGLLASFGGYATAVAISVAATTGLLFLAKLQYGEFAHFGQWLRKIPRQRSKIGVHMKVDDLQARIKAARSITELRITLSEGFAAMGFESARLKLEAYDSAMNGAVMARSKVALQFGLHSNQSQLGLLELCWDSKMGYWPFDLEYFTTDFLPVLCGKLKSFGLVYRDSQRAGRRLEQEILPSIAAEQGSAVRIPAN